VDVEKVFGLLRKFFDQEGEPLVVVGGLAMLTYGATRNTYDCDLLVRSAVRPRLRAFLESVGYRTVAETPGFSNHLHADVDLGRLDVFYVETPTPIRPFLNLTPEDVQALKAARELPPPPIEAILKMSRQLAPVVWDAVRRRPLPRGGFSLPPRTSR